MHKSWKLLIYRIHKEIEALEYSFKGFSMVGSIWVITKKIFSLSLILNALITLAAVAQIIFHYYQAFPYWQPYSPYIVNGSIFFLVIVAALVNIYPSASVGRTLHTGRFLFHHYVYGFFVLLSHWARLQLPAWLMKLSSARPSISGQQSTPLPMMPTAEIPTALRQRPPRVIGVI